jgi:hypothetical protein
MPELRVSFAIDITASGHRGFEGNMVLAPRRGLIHEGAAQRQTRTRQCRDKLDVQTKQTGSNPAALMSEEPTPSCNTLETTKLKVMKMTCVNRVAGRMKIIGGMFIL